MSNTRTIAISWQGDLRFEGGAPGGPMVSIDGDNTTAPGPMQQLLLAIASCSGSDVVGILEKARVTLRRCDIEVTGTRQEEHPRRYVAVHLTFRLAGDGLDETKARRAIELSVGKYCSVIHSLNPDIPITWDVELS
jgi:putative redox protein